MEQYFVEVISVLWTVIMGIGAFWLKRMSDKIDALVVHRQECLKLFADSNANVSAHNKLFAFVEDHEKRLTKVESEVGYLKTRECA